MSYDFATARLYAINVQVIDRLGNTCKDTTCSICGSARKFSRGLVSFQFAELQIAENLGYS